MDISVNAGSKTAGRFWKLSPSDQPAFILPDGSVISYNQLIMDVTSFVARIGDAKGLIAIHCDGSYRQYVAYLGALNASCPLLLMQDGQSPCQAGLTLTYSYSSKMDDLTDLNPEITPYWHPDLAVLLSTSGSTGAAKWVRLSFDNIAANALSIAQYLALSEHDRAPMALPFQYSYGLSIVNSHLLAGGALVLTEGSVIDTVFWKTFEAAGCTSLAGVPHSFELMEQARVQTEHLKTLRYMTQAGGRLPAPRVRSWVERGRAEGWDFLVMYGQTEAAPRISYLPSDMALATPESIGIAVPGGEIRLLDERGAPVPDGTEGELVYRGPNVMMGYASCDADLAAPQGGDLLYTGDMARRLPNGAFEIVGRRSRFVKLFGLRISLDEIEKHLGEAGISAACGAKGEYIYIFVSSEAGRQIDSGQIRTDVCQWLKIPPGCFDVKPIAAIPRRTNGKVDHPAIAAIIADLKAPQDDVDATPFLRKAARQAIDAFWPRRHSVIDVFQAHFINDRVSMNASFNSLGGDSLSYVSVALELENLLGDLPQDWADMTLTQLEAQIGDKRALASIDTATFVRALAILAIVAGHFNFINYRGGGAYSLFVVAGMSFFHFTLPQILRAERVYPLAVLAIRIAILTSAIALVILTVTGDGSLLGLSFISNWVSPMTAGAAWFIAVYLQLLCVAMLVLAMPVVRRALSNPENFWIIAAATAVAVAVAAASDALVDTHHLYRRLPHLMAWMFLIGVSAGAAKTATHRFMVTMLFAAAMWQFWGYALVKPNGIFFIIATLLIVWTSTLSVPRIMLRALRLIAGASLVIYLTHFQFASLFGKIMRSVAFDFLVVEPLEWFVAVVGGVILWRLYDPVDAWLGQRIRSIFVGEEITRFLEEERATATA